MSDLAGDWNSDGTRNHETNEQKWIVKIDSKSVDGYYNLIIKETTAQNKDEFKITWNKDKEAYVK
jgi:hypothetical protein